MFRAVPLPIIKNSFTVHLALVYVMQVGRPLSSRAGPCSKAVCQPAWHIPVPSVQWMNSWWWAEELPETCRGSFFSQINLVNQCICWFYYKEIGYDARSRERNICQSIVFICLFFIELGLIVGLDCVAITLSHMMSHFALTVCEFDVVQSRVQHFRILL